MSGSGGVEKLIVYGYERDDDVAQPSVVLDIESRDSDTVKVVVWIVDGWIETSGSALSAALPPMHLEVDYVAGADVPFVAMREPSFLAGVNPRDKRHVALAHVLASLGSSDPECDFNYDGNVDGDDIQFVLDQFKACD